LGVNLILLSNIFFINYASILFYFILFLFYFEKKRL